MSDRVVPPSAPSGSSWSLSKRVAFRLVLTFFAIEAILDRGFPVFHLRQFVVGLARHWDEESTAIAEWVEAALQRIGYYGLQGYWNDLVLFVGKGLFGADAPIEPRLSGSGDTLRNWTSILTALCCGVVLTLVWSLLDRRRRAHTFLSPWLWIFARFFLASVMFSYGISKIVPNQFQPPHLGRLLEPLGEFSPMGLLWTFMGYSQAYTIFAGAGEVLGGLLLCFRRTATLGALVTAGVMTNVVAMNYCYDVPVKLFASFYLATALGIATPDAIRLLNLFVLNRPTTARDLSRPFAAPALNVLATLLTLLWIGETGYWGVRGAWAQYRAGSVEARPRPTLYGIYEIESFSKDGVPITPLATDVVRWSRLIIDLPNFAVVHTMTHATLGFEIVIDSERRTLGLTPAEAPTRPWSIGPPFRPPGSPVPPTPFGPKQQFTLHYEETSPDLFTFLSEFEGSALQFVARRKQRDDFLLTSRTFSWVQQDPFNR